MKQKYSSIEEWKIDEQSILDAIDEHTADIARLKYDLECLKQRKPKVPCNWNILKCVFGFHVWSKPEDCGSKRVCKRCGIV